MNHPFARLEEVVAIERGTILLECEHSWRVINIGKMIIILLGNDEDICEMFNQEQLKIRCFGVS